MKINNNLLKRIFATTVAFATLATTGVTATVHADDTSVPGSGNPNFVNPDSKKWAIEHGYLNPDGTSVVENQPESKQQKIYNRDNVLKKTYYDGIPAGVAMNGSLGLTSDTSILPNPKYTPYLYELFFIDTFLRVNQNNNNSPLNSNSKYHKGYVNSTKMYKDWLHINLNKAFKTKKQTNNPKQYYKTHKEVNYMEPGYSREWLNKKIMWMNKNQNAALKEMRKYYNQSVLKDQRFNSTKNDFDNTTLK